MRIFSNRLETTLDRATIILTRSEMEELRDCASNLYDDPSIGHAHALGDLDQDVVKDITLTALESGDTVGFHSRIWQVVNLDT